MKNCFYAFVVAIFATTAMYAQDASFTDLMKAPTEVNAYTEGDVIWEPPCVAAGESITYEYELGCKGLDRVGLDDVLYDTQDGGRAYIVASTTTNEYYIKNPLPRTMIGSYIKGELIEKDNEKYIECKLPQLLNARESTNAGVKIIVGKKIINPDGMIFYEPVENEEEKVVRYVYDEATNGYIMEFDDPDKALIATYIYLDEEGDGIFAGAAVERVVYKDPGEKVPVEFPDRVMAKDWGMIYSNGIRVHNIKCAIVGNKVYLGGISPLFPSNCVVGTIEGDKVTFEANQYLGATDATYEYLVFNKARFISSEERGDVFDFEGDRLPSCVATYDAEAQTISCPMDVAWFCNAGTTSLYYSDFWVGPMFMPNVPGPATPSDPEIIEWLAYEPAIGYGGFIVELPLLGTNFEILDPDNYTYIVYFDGEPFTFTPEEYPGVPEAMTEIPYNFQDGAVEDFRVDGTSHIVCFRADGYESFGVQGVYNFEGDVRKSNVITQEFSSVANNRIDYPEVKAIEFYDLSGRKVIEPEAGIYIKRISFEGGKVITEKVVIRRK